MAYFVNSFPGLTESFIYKEVRALRALGNAISVFSIRRPDDADVSEEARNFLSETHYILPAGPLRLLAVHLSVLARYPLRYCRAFTAVVVTGSHCRFRDRIRSACHFVEAVSVVPAVRALEVDLLHAHWATGATTCAMVVSKLLDIPFTFTAHAYDIYRDRLLLKEKLTEAQRVITCTDYNRRFLTGQYPTAAADKVEVVHHGVEAMRFRPEQRPARPEPVILAVARLVEQKGLDRLLRACAVLASEGHRFRCEIVGWGPLQSKLEALVRQLGLTDRVQLRGRLFQEQIAACYQAADLFVLPCVKASDGDQDGIPNTLMEAMAMCLPVVSTRFSGVPELVLDGVTGLLVEADDTPALTSAIRSLLVDPDKRHRMGEQGRTRVVEQFSLEHSARLLHRILGAVANPENSTAPAAAETLPPFNDGFPSPSARMCALRDES